MVSLVGCVNKNRLKKVNKNPCLDCKKRNKGCKRKHELIDSSILCNVYLHKENIEKWENLLKNNGIKFTGYITTIQIGHILRAFNRKIHTLKVDKKDTSIIEEDLKKCILELTNYHILDFDENAQTVYDELLKESLYMESHDKMNVAIAIWNHLYIQVQDKDLEDDFTTIQEVSHGFGHNLKINGEYD